MFTGIVQGVAEVVSVVRQPGLHSFGLRLPERWRHNLAVGGSVAVNGTCLTITREEHGLVWFDAMQQTLSLTNLGSVSEGDFVNFERAARIGDEIGGHLMSGHIHTVATLIQRDEPENNCVLWFEIEAQWQQYIFSKGYIGINGCSLTLAEVEDNRFCIWLIPETLRATTFGAMVPGTQVNIEIDSQTQTIVDTLKRLGYDKPPR